MDKNYMKNRKCHTVGTVPKSRKNRKCHTVGTVPKSRKTGNATLSEQFQNREKQKMPHCRNSSKI
jgi:hypothetical protein